MSRPVTVHSSTATPLVLATQPGRPAMVSPRPCPARNLLLSVVDVLNGRRSLAQLEDRLDWLIVAALSGSLRAGARARRTTATVTSLRVTHPSDNAIEACAVVTQGPRSRALVARLERSAHGYTCTVLRML
jgi:Family of unknown function (DUF6459)